MIYVLEDDESIRELIIYTLNGQSMEARGFAAPSEFWAAMSEKTPSLVLLDIMLPEEASMTLYAGWILAQMTTSQNRSG